MSKLRKSKISKVKRNNQTTNKMKKQGKLKLQRHRAKPQKQRQPTQPQHEYSSGTESESGEEWTDMLEEGEQEYIMNRLAKQPHLLNNIPEEEKQNVRSRKRKRDKESSGKKYPSRDNGAASDSGVDSDINSDADIEGKFEREMAERPVKKLRPLLPIKTKHGLMERTEECEESESEQEQVEEKVEEITDISEIEDTRSSPTEGGVVTAVQLLAERRDRLNHDKLRIGALCSSLLEMPEKKLKNFYPIMYLMEERLKDGVQNFHSIRKLATLSVYEVFKDILPEYKIRHQDYSNVKLKKDTLAIYKYENELLSLYKRYLQRLEKASNTLRRKKGDTRKLDESDKSLALISLQCLCGLLVARPNFNYATNIAQSIVPFLDSKEPQACEIVTECCTTVFTEDKKGEITLKVVRLINQLVKRRGERLNPSALNCLLSLKIRDVELDAEKDLQQKKKQDEKHKKRIVNLSKKEKKRAKKLKEVERELLETQAQESEMSRQKQLTEVTKTVFHIYFRLLKTAPGSKLLASVLNGLAKFTHVINLEYYTDLVAILSRLLGEGCVGLRERLLCVRTALAVLAGSGDAVGLDPARFHRHLYGNALAAHAGNTHDEAKIVVDAIAQVCSRARRVSAAVLQAFAKRLLALAAQLQHGGALACLALLQRLAQQCKCVSALFEQDDGPGSGRYEPLLESPEHCNAHAASVHELCALRRHYHPTVAATAGDLLKSIGTQASGLNKMSPVQIFEMYDGSQMAFKPSIPPPKQITRSDKPIHKHTWTLRSLEEECNKIEETISLTINNFSLKIKKEEN